jgi:hypothetical protein
VIIRNSKVYLLSCDKEMSQGIALTAILKRPALDRVPGLENFLFIPQLPEAVILVSSTPTATLAENLRRAFPDRIFMLSLVTDVDGYLPKAAWEFIRANTGFVPVA